MQLRLLAHLSGDTQLKETFRRGEDIHSKTAEKLGVSRQQAKSINFGICFGQGAESLAAELGIGVEQAQLHIDGFFKTYAGAGDFFDATVGQSKSRKEMSGHMRLLLEGYADLPIDSPTTSNEKSASLHCSNLRLT